MPEPELNDLLKLLEKKYTKKPEGDAPRATPPAARPADAMASPPAAVPPPVAPPPAGAAPPRPPVTAGPPPPAAAVPPRPVVAPPAAAVPPAPRPPSLAPPPPAAAVAPAPRPPSIAPPPPAPAAPDQPAAGADPAAPTAGAPPPPSPPAAPPPPGAGMISSLSVPRRGASSTPGGRRPPPPSSGFGGFGGGVASRFTSPGGGTPSGFSTPPVAGAPSAFGGGTPSTFGGGAPSAFGGGSAPVGGAPSAFAPPPPPSEAQPVAAAPAPAAPRRSDEPAQAHYGLVVKPIPKPLNTALRQVDNMNIIRAIRPRVGRETSLWMFRAAYFMGLLQSHGRDFHPWSLLAGRKFGQLVQVPDYESVDKAFRQLKIGRVHYSEDNASVMFDVQECVICSGVMGIEEPCCGFVGGLLGSVVQRVTGRDVVVKETQCTATSHDVCRFMVTYSRGVVATE